MKTFYKYLGLFSLVWLISFVQAVWMPAEANQGDFCLNVTQNSLEGLTYTGSLTCVAAGEWDKDVVLTYTVNDGYSTEDLSFTITSGSTTATYQYGYFTPYGSGYVSVDGRTVTLTIYADYWCNPDGRAMKYGNGGISIEASAFQACSSPFGNLLASPASVTWAGSNVTTTVTLSNKKGSGAVSWSVSPSSIATISGSGNSATVTIKGVDGKQSATVTVTCSIALNGDYCQESKTLDITVNAKKRKITYKANGGTGSDQTQDIYVGVQTTTKAASTFTAPSCKKFKQWNTKADGTGSSKGSAVSITLNGDADITFYAIWEDVTATVSTSVSPASTGTAKIDGNTSMTATCGTGYDIVATPNTGYEFDKWSTPTYGSIADINAASTTYTAGSSNQTLTANFKAKTYTVNLDGESPTTVGSANVTMTYNSSSHTAITNPQKTGYSFAGWYSEAGGNGSLVISAAGVLQANVLGYTGANGIWVRTTEPTTLYAKWINSYTLAVANVDHVTINATSPALNEGQSNTTMAAGTTVTLAYSGIDTSNGYSWAGWNVYRTDDPTTTVTVTGNQFTMPSHDVTVSAKLFGGIVGWCEKEVIYIVNGTTEHIATVDGSGNVPAHYPSLGCTDKMFVGWASSEVSSLQQTEPTITTADGSMSGVTENTTLYAVYASPNGGKVTGSHIIIEDFESYTASASYSNTGLSFNNANGLSWLIDYGNVTTTGASNFGTNTNDVVLSPYQNSQNSGTGAALKSATAIKDLLGVSLWAGKAKADVAGKLYWSNNGSTWDESNSKALDISTTTSATTKIYKTEQTFATPQDLYLKIFASNESPASGDHLYLDNFSFTIADRQYYLTDYSTTCDRAASPVELTWVNGEGATVSSGAEPASTAVGTWLTLPILTRANYRFEGWKATIEGYEKAEIYFGDEQFLVNHAVTFTAQWTHSISWYNGMLDTEYANNFPEDGKLVLPTGDDPVSCNTTLYPTFCGWIDHQIPSYATTEPTYVSNSTDANHEIYYAVFKDATRNRWYTSCPTYYTITYKPNGGTGTDYVQYTDNTTADAISVETAGFTKTGSVFVGWTNPADESGTVITPGTGKITGLTGDITLNAVWIGEVSITGTVRLTSAAGEKVATATDDITIHSADLTCATALRITYRDVTNNKTFARTGELTYTSSEFRLCNSSYAVADGSNINISEVTGEYNQTFSITYEPTGGANTLDEYELKVEVLMKNTVIATQTLPLYGRTLPDNFVIATKIGSNWYALPNNMPQEGTYDPVLITVTEGADVLSWSAQGSATVGYKMKDYTADYAKLRFAASDTDAKCLWASNNDSPGIRNWSASSTEANYAWALTETGSDFSTYTLKNKANTRAGLKIYGNKWTMYNAGGYSEMHLIPLTTVEPLDLTVMEWGTNEVAVKTVANWNPSAISAQIGSGSESSVTKTLIGGDIYRLTGVGNLQAAPGLVLIINATDGTKKQAIIQIPLIIANGESKSEKELTELLTGANLTAKREVAKSVDVVVLNGGTMTNASSASGYFKDLYIYPGAKAEFTNDLGLQNVYLRGGFSWLDAAKDFRLPQMKVATGKYIKGIGTSGNGVYYDMYADKEMFYMLALPRTVNVGDITNEEGTRKYGATIKYYSGKGRTETPKYSTTPQWTEITSYEENLERGVGYEIAIKTRNGRKYGILRFPLLKNSGWKDEDEIQCKPQVHNWGYTDRATLGDNNVGWNLIGNPYFSSFTNDISGSGSSLAIQGFKEHLVNGSWNGTYDWDEAKVKYYTIPNKTDYGYIDVTSKDYQLEAFYPFYLQSIIDGTITSFSAANRVLKAPASVRSMMQNREIEVMFVLQNDETVSPQSGLFISDDYSAEFDMEDKEISITEGVNELKIYTMVGAMRVAFNSLPESAIANIPMGYKTTEAGDYTIALRELEDLMYLKSAVLIDHELGDYEYNLLYGAYEFYTDAMPHGNDTRFTLQLIFKSEDYNTPTGMSDVSGLDKLSVYSNVSELILHNLPSDANVWVYDMTGKLIAEQGGHSGFSGISGHSGNSGLSGISGETGTLRLSVPAGVYNIRIQSGNEGRTMRAIVK